MHVPTPPRAAPPKPAPQRTTVRLKLRDGRALARRPADGWVRARPYAMSSPVRRAFHGLILAIVPPPPAPAPDDLVARIDAHVRLHMAYMHWTSARGLALVFLLVSWLPVALLWSGRPLHRLPRERAAALLTRLARSSSPLARTLVIAVRGSISSAYFDQDEVHRAMGYEPLPFLRERIARRAQLLAEGGGADDSHVRRKVAAPADAEPRRTA